MQTHKMTLFKDELNDILSRHADEFINDQSLADVEGYDDEIIQLINKYYISKEELKEKIDDKINDIQKSIDSFTPECGYAMVNQSQQKLTIQILNEIKAIFGIINYVQHNNKNI